MIIENDKQKLLKYLGEVRHKLEDVGVDYLFLVVEAAQIIKKIEDDNNYAYCLYTLEDIIDNLTNRVTECLDEFTDDVQIEE